MGTIVDAANCSVTPGAGGAFVIVKTGGTDGTADAGAVSAAAIAGPFLLRVKPLGAGLFYAGVAASPAGVSGASGIDRAVQVNAGVCRPYEAGQQKPGAFALDTYLWVRRSAGVLDYLTGPTLAAAALKRTASDSGAALFFDCAIAAAGLSIEVKFDLPSGFVARRPRRGLTLGLNF